MIELSVIIVLYNEYELVKKTISSIYQNKVDDMEIILIDNSSVTSGYKDLLDKFPKVTYHKSKENLGFAKGVNEGLIIAKGKFIIILTPDMYILKNTIKKVRKLLK